MIVKSKRRWISLSVVAILGILLLALAACGDDPEPVAVAPTAAPAAEEVPSGPVIRPQSEWTEAEPATLEEIEHALSAYRGETLNITSWGGSWQGYVRQAYWAPFTEKFGIQIIEDSPISSAKIRSMAETGNVTWDVVDFGTRTVYSLGEVGALEEMTPAIHGGYMDGLPEVTKTPWSAGGGVFWSMGIAYSLDSYPNHVGAPKNFADVWDAERFPGRRSLQARANENVIFAQMALHPEKMETQEGRASLGSLTDAQVDEGADKKFAVVEPGVTLQDLVNGLNALGIGPRDLITILQAIKTAGALQAEIVVM